MKKITSFICVFLMTLISFSAMAITTSDYVIDDGTHLRCLSPDQPRRLKQCIIHNNKERLVVHEALMLFS